MTRIERMANEILQDYGPQQSFTFQEIQKRYKHNWADTHDALQWLMDAAKVVQSTGNKYTVRGQNWLTVKWR